MQRHRALYTDVSLPSTAKTIGRGNFAFVQIFHNISPSFYYAVLINEISQLSNFNSSVIDSNRCKNINEIFNTTIIHEYSYLKRLKLYHLPCRDDHHLRWFFDEYRIYVDWK